MPSVTTKSPAAEVRARQDRRSLRYSARRVLHHESSLKRVRFCGVDAIKTKDGYTHDIAIKASGTGTERRAGIAGVQHCGSTWACPVCSHKINAVRAEELANAVSRWHESGGRIVFATLTMRHKRGQRLNDLWTNGISAGWGKVTSGRGWKRDQELYGTPQERVIKSGAKAGTVVTENRIGFARVVETTQGRNGWHVHIHALLFVRGDITTLEAMDLGDAMFGRWVPALTAAGFGSPSLRHGIDVRLIGPQDSNKVAEYFSKNTFAGKANSTKVGWEAAGGSGKVASKRFGNRTPFEILADITLLGDADDLALWWEWEEASKGKRQLTWSPWLRAALKLAEEKSDDEIVEEDLGGDVVVELRPAQHEAIRGKIEKLLDAVEADDDMTAAHAWLRKHLVSASGDPLYSPGQFSAPLVLVAS